jgi:O-antigen/teichoic acid export membrane protein
MLLNIIIKPIWILGIDRPIQNLVGAAEYGHYFSLLNLSLIASFILDLGLNTYFNRQLATGEFELKQHAGQFLFTRILLSLVYAVVVVVICLITGVTRWDIVAGVIIIQILLSFFLFFRSIITATQNFTADAWLSVIDKTLLSIVAGSMLLFPAFKGQLNIEAFILIQVITIAIAVLTSVLVLLLKGQGFRLTFRFPNRNVFRNAWPYALIILLMTIHARADAFLLERFRTDGAAQAGIYANAYRLLDAANMFGYLAASFLLPFLSANWLHKNYPGKVIRRIRNVLLVFSATVALVALFFAQQIQALLYKTGVEDTVIGLCLPVLLAYSLTQVYGTVLTAIGRIRIFSLIVFGSMTLNLALNFFLIPVYGAKGCCIAALITQSICGLLTMLYSNWKIKTDLSITLS